MYFYKIIAHRKVSDDELFGPKSSACDFKAIDNALETPGRYLGICKLDDIWALDRKVYEKRPDARQNEYLPAFALRSFGNDLKTGRCFLLFDLSGEGHPFVRDSFDDLHAWCIAAGVSPVNIGLISQNRVIAKNYAAAYGSDFIGLRFFTYDWIINGLADRFQQDETTFFNTFRFQKNDRRVLTAAALEHPFLCLNATPRPLRLGVLGALSAKGILERTLWSLLKESSGKGSLSEDQLRAFIRKIDGTVEMLEHAKAILMGPEHRLDDLGAIRNSNGLIWSIDYRSYADTIVSIVTETDFTSGDIMRITEKSIKPIAMGHPILIFGNPGSLKLLRDFGFRTFDPIVDEGYDQVNSLGERFMRVLQAAVRLDYRLRDNSHQFLSDVREVCEYNFSHARSGRFLAEYKACVEAPLLNELRACLNLNLNCVDNHSLA